MKYTAIWHWLPFELKVRVGLRWPATPVYNGIPRAIETEVDFHLVWPSMPILFGHHVCFKRQSAYVSNGRGHPFDLDTQCAIFRLLKYIYFGRRRRKDLAVDVLLIWSLTLKPFGRLLPKYLEKDGQFYLVFCVENIWTQRANLICSSASKRFVIWACSAKTFLAVWFQPMAT